jgi:predicted negative regulator of RcsB-dependent stress response
MTAKPKRRWYQFSLKTLLVVLTLLCLGPGGYVAYEQRKAREQKAAVEAIEKLGGKVETNNKVPGRSPMLRQILGDESVGNVVSVTLNDTDVTDAGLVHLSGLKGLKHLSLNKTQVTDAGLQHLSGLKELTYLCLDGRQMTESGLRHLAGLKELKYLQLQDPELTDAGLVHLAKLKGLKSLFLDNTQVTDSGLVHLAGVKSLTWLTLINTQVTDAGIAELQKALPKCKISHGKAPRPSAIGRWR